LHIGEQRHEKQFQRATKAMRAEIQTLVDEIKQSLGLLRRHL
jgi:hypothetical protein